jgi:hypothetical protein
MEKYINCPLWVFIIACIICGIFCGIAIWGIIDLQLAWRHHKRMLKINPNYEAEAREKEWKKEWELRGKYSCSGGSSTTENKDTSNWDNNNINLMTTGTF